MSEQPVQHDLQQKTNELMVEARQQVAAERDKRMALQSAYDFQNMRPANAAAEFGTKMLVRTIGVVGVGLAVAFVVGGFRREKKTA